MTYYEHQKECYMCKRDDIDVAVVPPTINLVNTTSFSNVVKNSNKWPKYFSFRPSKKPVHWKGDARGRKGSL